MGLLWERQEGYVAGLPEPVQRLVFGGLARLTRQVGCHRRARRLCRQETGNEPTANAEKAASVSRSGSTFGKYNWLKIRSVAAP